MSADPTLTVDVQVASSAEGIPPVEDIRTWVSGALAACGQEFVPGTECSVRVVDIEEIRTLNRDYREQDKATNVLSFPAGEVTGLPAGEVAILGDIVVCAAVVAAEAAEQGKSLADHWAHMLVHGTLHLVGYDHGDAAQAAEMEGLEKRILEHYGIGDPYGESR